MASVEVRSIRKSFQEGRPILDSVSFSAEDGEFVSLLGASGCGKTTLLRVIAGLERAEAGTVRIGGREVGPLSPKERDVAMVFQSYALYPHLSVERNIAVGLELRGTAAAEAAARVREAAAMLGLSQLLTRRPSELSGGQRQRVALARALVRRPQLFLLDEPLSNLDALLRDKTRGELRLLFKRAKGTVLYVTHDQVEAMTMSDRILLLDKGRVQQFGTPEEIYERPANAFVASFVGAPPMNLLDEEKAADAGLCAAGKRRVLGIRPDKVAVSGAAAPGFVEAAVVLAEPTGPHTVLTLDCAGLSLRAVVPSWERGRARAYVALPGEARHHFDRESGARIEN